jgi:putative ABC transport system permease protein
MRATLRRARAFAGQLALLAALTVVAALLVSGVPRVANRYTDDGLRADLARLPHTVRDLTVAALPAPSPDLVTERLAVNGDQQLDAYRAQLPAPAPGLIGGQWYTVRVGPGGVESGGDQAPFVGACTPSLSVRTLSGADRAIRLVEGRAPASAGTVEAMLARPAAAALGLRVGSTFTLTGLLGPVPIRVVGVFEQLDPAAPMWADMPLTQTSCPNPADGVRVQAGLLTDAPGVRLAGERTGELATEWRYRMDETRLSAPDVPALATAVAAARRDPPPQTNLITGLDAALARYAAQQDAVAALLAVVQAGVIATLLGLLLLAAALVVEQRRAEFALIRARGGAAVTIGGRLLAETLLVAPAAVVVGWLAGSLLPGRPPAHGWLPLTVMAATATLTAPVLAAVAQRHPAFTGRRRDLARSRPSVRRVVGEAFVVLLAVLGVLLVRRRGLDAADGVDPYLVVVPELLAVAVALIVMRALPWPLRLAGRVAARARGAVPFLGLAGAGRGSFAHAAPLAVLVVAVATGVFTGAVTSTIGDARDRAADQAVPGDALITGTGFSAATAHRLAAVPGVTAVAPMWTGSSPPLDARGPDRGLVRVHVVDGPAAERVLRRSGNTFRLPAALTRPGPAALTRPGPAGDTAPAMVSPDLADEFARGGAVDVQGNQYRFHVAAVSADVPGIDLGAQRFVVLAAQALPVPAGQPLRFNRFTVAGAGADPAVLRRVGAAGQRDYLAGATGRPLADWRMPPTTVTTRSAYRASLEDSGVNRVLGFTFAAGAVGSVVLAVLTVGFAVLAGAPGRGAVLSRLRTLGLSAAQGRRLLVYELVPLLGVAVLAGGLVGVALPRLIGPALGLSGFTAGVAARSRLDLPLLAAVLAAVVLAIGTALLVESAANRRMRLGEALRLGEENG